MPRQELQDASQRNVPSQLSPSHAGVHTQGKTLSDTCQGTADPNLHSLPRLPPLLGFFGSSFLFLLCFMLIVPWSSAPSCLAHACAGGRTARPSPAAGLGPGSAGAVAPALSPVLREPHALGEQGTAALAPARSAAKPRREQGRGSGVKNVVVLQSHLKLATANTPWGSVLPSRSDL